VVALSSAGSSLGNGAVSACKQAISRVSRLGPPISHGHPYEGLAEWLRDFTAGAATYRDLSSTLMMNLMDTNSPFHASCVAMRESGGRLLKRAQRTGRVRKDVNSTDLFALVGAIA
jgi:hypothetical protein